MKRRTTKSSRRKGRGHLLTERRNPRSHDLDAMPLSDAFDVMNSEDRSVPVAVARAKPEILRAVRIVSKAWQSGGRLIYVGAGTSGRLGVLDAAECPPTFRSDPKMVRGMIAGGKKALWRSVEGAEDDERAAVRELTAMRVGRRDVVMGIATGGTTPYVHAALSAARKRGAKTIFFACVPRSQVKMTCDVDIRVLAGPEVLSGSTRLKAGTATKLVLNMITTLSMVRIGKTFGNLMVDLNSYACRKLTERATRVITDSTGIGAKQAARLLREARGRAKSAIVMQLRGLSRKQAEALLNRCAGHVSTALAANASDRRLQRKPHA